MAIYYINSRNASSNALRPYDRPEKGANNFYQLVVNPATKINLFDGDEIVLYNPCPDGVCIIDDSTYDVDIDKGVVIRTHLDDNGIHVKLKVIPKPPSFNFT